MRLTVDVSCPYQDCLDGADYQAAAFEEEDGAWREMEDYPSKQFKCRECERPVMVAVLTDDDVNEIEFALDEHGEGMA